MTRAQTTPIRDAAATLAGYTRAQVEQSRGIPERTARAYFLFWDWTSRREHSPAQRRADARYALSTGYDLHGPFVIAWNQRRRDRARAIWDRLRAGIIAEESARRRTSFYDFYNNPADQYNATGDATP